MDGSMVAAIIGAAGMVATTIPAFLLPRLFPQRLKDDQSTSGRRDGESRYPWIVPSTLRAGNRRKWLYCGLVSAPLVVGATVAVVVFLTSGAGVERGPNLVGNQSFEEGDGRPAGWQRGGEDTETLAKWCRTLARSGKSSVLLTGRIANADCEVAGQSGEWVTMRSIDIDRSRTYELSWWYLPSQENGSRGGPSAVGLQARTSWGTSAGTMMYGLAAADEPVERWLHYVRIITPDDWAEDFNDPVDSVRVVIFAGFTNQCEPGYCEVGPFSVWVDDLHFGILK